MRYRITAIFLLVALSAVPAQDGRASAEQIKKHIAHLASDLLQGRRAGLPGSDRAAQYIESEFRRYGLATSRQHFSFVAELQLGKKNLFEINAKGSVRRLRLGRDFMPMAFSSSKEAAGQLVFAGYGISAPELQHDDYAGIDVGGKIALVMLGSPDGDDPHGRFAEQVAPGRELQNKAIAARQKNASAIVFISDSDDLPRSSLSKLRPDLNFLDAGIAAFVISAEAARSIFALAGKSFEEVKRLAAPTVLEGSTARLRADLIRISRETSNVIGVLSGSDLALASEHIIIGAHYDHLGLGGPESLGAEGQIHRGADDNASGVAALLELARTLVRERPRRSIFLIAFGAEEVGLLGSSAYTKSPLAPLSSTVAMINMDMIGRLRDGRLIVGGAGTSPSWKPLLEQLNPGFRLALQDDGYGPSDHQSFYVRDIPVLFFFTGSHDDYHKPSDTAEKINAEGVRQIAEFVGRIAISIANRDDRIAFARVEGGSRPAGRGFRVYLGTVPNYSEQGDGLKLDGVRPGSPAERAGLRAGDVIIRLGDMRIKNVYDYTYALGQLRPGQQVEVTVRRGESEITLKITPERRQ